MKLIDNNKRFQFIKNQQVEIDSDLPKYQKLRLIKEAGEAYEAVDPNQHEGETEPDGNINNRIFIPPVQNGQRIMTPPSDWHKIDGELRELIADMKSNEIRKYLGKSDAEEFNKSFLPILLGEVNVNRMSLAIGPNRWYGEPVADSGVSVLDVVKKPTLADRIKGFFKTKEDEQARRDVPKGEVISMLDLFDVIHVETGKEREFIDRVDGYFKLMVNAYKMHQEAQIDELCQHMVLNVYESVLAAQGLNRYITFGNIEKLQEKCKVVLDIDYIKNFGRIIPDSVVENKTKADEMCVFDNYCILYFDPNKTAYKATAKEKRDPILFGLINHSDKLYYIDSWEDELCDLTIDTIAEKLGKEVIETIK